LKINDKVKLNCGHHGVVVGVYGSRVAVKGMVRNRCDVCSKRYEPYKSWSRMPTVYIIALEDSK